ncbi:MAG: FimV/HubP family polar landmark protein [Porticoccaceae bacterium]|nr:FimV/HubP family polar landmark protein [Porticoccaceae bacterium]
MITKQWSIKLAIASVLAALLYTTTAIAVGFGDITLKSALNEPLDAEIALTNIEGIDEGLLLVQLAPAEAFAQAGVTRDYYLTQLAFSVDTNAAGETVVKATSEGPILEPYLDFLVQLEWPAGRLVREYTLLLDLPIYSGEETSAKSVEFAAVTPKATVSAANRKLSGDAHRVVVGDTLWNVSKRLRPRGSTILQTMDALYSQNPAAFVDGDANKMKEGAILRLPSYDDIQREAGDIVAVQIGLTEEQPALAPQLADEEIDNSLFDESVADDSALDEDIFAISAEDDASSGRLELASALDESANSTEAGGLGNDETESTDMAANVGDDVEQLATDLAVAQDEQNRTELENIELRERMALLEAQVDLMSDLAAVSETQAAVEAESEAATAVPAKIAKPNKPLSLVDQIERQPWYIWAVAGSILLVLLLLLRRSRINKESDLDQPLDGDVLAGDQSYQDYDQEPAVNTGANLLIDDLDGLELNPEDNLFDETDKEIFPEEDSAVSPEIFDSMVEAVAEAEVYLSLGNLEQAVEILEEARAADATDTAARLKLMEILFREERRDELADIYAEIEQTGDEVATAMASVILGPEEEVVANIVEESAQADEQPLEAESSLEVEEILAADEPEEIEVSEEAQPAESEAVPEIDISDLLEGALESGGEIETDALDESVLAGDFDDSFMDGGIFSDEISPDNEAEKGVELPGVAELQQTVGESVSTNLDDFDDYDTADDINAVDVKLDLANTYIEMGDPEGAREILEEIIGESDAEGQAKARAVLESL